MSFSDKESGYSLLELGITLFIVAGLVTSGSILSGSAVSSTKRSETGQKITVTKADLQRFIIVNDRLPCPDSNGDGVENCLGPAFGTLPHLTLKLPGEVVDSNGNSLLYAANSALLDPTAITPASWDYSGISLSGFCKALSSEMTAVFDSAEPAVAKTSSCNGASGALNPAFILLSSGLADLDGDGISYDGINANVSAGTSICVENPDKSGTNVYDDKVEVIGFAELFGKLCLASDDKFVAGPG